LQAGAKDKEHAMSSKLNTAIAVAGIDIGKNSFHVIGLDKRGASCCGTNGRAARWKRGLPTRRLA
jgi:transposase